MKRGYLIALLALILAACGTAASPTTVSVTAVPATPAQAAAASATPPATATPPAAPVASPAPAGAVVPIVDPHNGFLLGGARNGEWLPSAVAAPLIVGDETYRLYGTASMTTELSGGSPELVGVPCQDLQKITLSGGTADDLVALGGTWDALPRTPEDLSTDEPVYREAVAELLHEAGIADPEVRITRILRIDLDGDGVDEVLLTATYSAKGNTLPSTASGDYSLVALRTLVGNTVETTIIDKDIHLTAEEFAAPTEFTLRGVADLNGDGTLEVLIDWSYYEGAGLQVYAVDGPQVTAVLGAGCGV